MTGKAQEDQFDKFTADQRKMMLKKGNDYSNGDRLSCFKKVAAMLDITPELVCEVFMATKQVRIRELLASGKGAENESVQDSILDLANYTILLNMIAHEKTTTIPNAPVYNPNPGTPGILQCKERPHITNRFAQGSGFDL